MFVLQSLITFNPHYTINIRSLFSSGGLIYGALIMRLKKLLRKLGQKVPEVVWFSLLYLFSLFLYVSSSLIWCHIFHFLLNTQPFVPSFLFLPSWRNLPTWIVGLDLENIMSLVYFISSIIFIILYKMWYFYHTKWFFIFLKNKYKNWWTMIPSRKWNEIVIWVWWLDTPGLGKCMICLARKNPSTIYDSSQLEIGNERWFKRQLVNNFCTNFEVSYVWI